MKINDSGHTFCRLTRIQILSWGFGTWRYRCNMQSNKKLWEPSESWLRNHTSSDLVYSVVVRLDSKEAVDKVWQQCAARNLVDDAERTVTKESEQDIERLPQGTLSHDVGSAEAGSNGPAMERSCGAERA